MQIIIPLRDLRKSLEDRLGAHARRYNYLEYGKITPARMTDLLEAFIVDHVTMRLKHGDKTRVADGLLYTYWPIFTAAQREAIYRDTMADIQEALESKISYYLPTYAWNIWTCQQIGRDLLITIGRDYRIVEWERLTNYDGSDDGVR